MSVTRKKAPETESAESSEYPVLKKGNKKGTISLFTEANTGMCLDSGDSKHAIGRFSEKWKEKYFTKTTEEVVVQND